MKKPTSSLIDNHINANKRIYLILLIIYFISMLFGAFCVSFLSGNDINGLHDFFEDFIDAYKTSKVDFIALFLNVYLSNIKYLFIMFIAAFIVIGLPFVVITFCCRVFYIGFVFGSILKVYGFSGLLFGLGNIFLQNFLSLPLLMVFCVLSIKFSTALFLTVRKKTRYLKNNTSFEKDVVSYILSFIFFAVLMAGVNLVETFLVMIFV